MGAPPADAAGARTPQRLPDDWTDTGMPDGRRAFMMGNALVVGLVEQIGAALALE